MIRPKVTYHTTTDLPSSVVREDTIPYGFIGTLQKLKYEYRPDITNRATLEANFREKFEALNRVRLTDAEFARLLDEIVTPDVFTASKTLRAIDVPMCQRHNGIPAQGATLGTMSNTFPRSEGTPHIPEWRTCTRSILMRRSFRTHELHPAHTRGCTPGWYAIAPLGRRNAPKGPCIPTKGETLDPIPGGGGGMSAGFPMSQRDTAYQPRATPWETGPYTTRALKERCIVRARVGGATICDVPSERGDVCGIVPRALPWAGMRCSVGAKTLVD